MTKRILVGLAGTSYSDAAIQQAVDLARSHGAELTGVTVVDTQKLGSVGAAPIGAQESGIQLREHRLQVTSERVEQVIAAFGEACAAENVPHSVHREEGDAFDSMLSYSRYHDLTVFGLRGVFGPIQTLGLCVPLDKVDQSGASSCFGHVGQRYLVYREEGGRSAVFGTHVRYRGSVRQID